MMRPNDLHLPPEAALIDRWTLLVWRSWDGWLREAMRLARSIAIGIVVVASVAWFVFDGSQNGVFGAVIAGAIVLGIGGGMGVAGGRRSGRVQASVGQVILAVLIGGLLGLLLLSLGLMLSILVISFVVTPALNYPWLALVVLPSALAAGWAMRKIREKRTARYP